MIIGQELRLKQGKNIINIKLDKIIANLPSSDLYSAYDNDGEKYIFSVYDGLKTIYSLGKYEDGLWGTKVCTMKVSLIDKLRGWFKL